MSQNILLISDTMIKERTSVHGNIDPKLIYPDIKVAQDMYILPLLGSQLFDKLQGMVGDRSINEETNAKYKLLIDRFIADALIYFTLAELPTTIGYQFWGKGVMRKQDDNSSLPSMSELIDISNKYKSRGEFYASRLRMYLQANAVSDYPEYFGLRNKLDDISPSRDAYTCPIYLGPDGDGCGQVYQPYNGGNTNG